MGCFLSNGTEINEIIKTMIWYSLETILRNPRIDIEFTSMSTGIDLIYAIWLVAGCYLNMPE